MGDIIMVIILGILGITIVGGSIFLWFRLLWKLGGMLGRVCNKD